MESGSRIYILAADSKRALWEEEKGPKSQQGKPLAGQSKKDSGTREQRKKI